MVQTYPAVAGIVQVITANVSTNSTINLANSLSSIVNVLAMRQDTLATITTSISGTTITITQAALVNVNVTLLVGGTR